MPWPVPDPGDAGFPGSSPACPGHPVTAWPWREARLPGTARGAGPLLFVALMAVKRVEVEAWGVQNAFGFENCKNKKKKKAGNLCT